ncbi:MAG: DUF3793 family protein [Clostridiales bacterium]|jgi:hypothetical protein|nr:DUF3793 family protein [Clostridiales bacterium]
MDNPVIDAATAAHIGPVIFGKKPAALFAKPANWDGRAFYNWSGLRFIILNRSDGSCGHLRNQLVFAYDQSLLKEALCVAKDALDKEGYDSCSSLTSYLFRLRKRFLMPGSFPHEVGFFLGYPPEDVIGFIENKGKGFKLCGFWKVYGDVEKSTALFKEYSWCRKKLEELVKNGGINSAAEALASVAM